MRGLTACTQAAQWKGSQDSIIGEVESLRICPGNNDDNYVDLAKRRHGRLTNAKGETIATLEDTVQDLNRHGRHF